MSDNAPPVNFIELTASIVSAYVSNNPVPSAELPTLIGQVHSALSRVSTGQTEGLSDSLKPSIAVKKSISSDFIVCLEDEKNSSRLSATCARNTTSRRNNIAANGGCRRTIRWSPRTMLQHVRGSPSRWAWANSAGAENNLTAAI